MQKISKFVINKAERQGENTVELAVEVDTKPQKFLIQVDMSSGGMIADFSQELEFLLRANDNLLSKNLLKFLKTVFKNETYQIPCVVFSDTEKKLSRKSKRQLQTV